MRSVTAEDADIVEVDWLDHAFHFGAHKPRPLKGLMTITSVGYLVHRDNDVLILAQSVSGSELHECLHLQASLVLNVYQLKRRKR